MDQSERDDLDLEVVEHMTYEELSSVESPAVTEKLDEKTERLITDLIVVAIKQFRSEATRAEIASATSALRSRIREMTVTPEEASAILDGQHAANSWDCMKCKVTEKIRRISEPPNPVGE